MVELRERVRRAVYGGTYGVYVVRRENVTGSLQIMLMGHVGEKGWDKGNM